MKSKLSHISHDFLVDYNFRIYNKMISHYLRSLPLKRLSRIIAIINRRINRWKIRILKQHAFIQTLLTYLREALFWNTCGACARVPVLLTWPPSGRIATSAWSGAASGHAEVVGHWPHDWFIGFKVMKPFICDKLLIFFLTTIYTVEQ